MFDLFLFEYHNGVQREEPKSDFKFCDSGCEQKYYELLEKVAPLLDTTFLKSLESKLK